MTDNPENRTAYDAAASMGKVHWQIEVMHRAVKVRLAKASADPAVSMGMSD